MTKSRDVSSLNRGPKWSRRIAEYVEVISESVFAPGVEAQQPLRQCNAHFANMNKASDVANSFADALSSETKPQRDDDMARRSLNPSN
jgi:hypothetical protein